MPGAPLPLAMSGLPCHLELKAQLVTSRGNGLDRLDIVEVPADVVVGIVELAVLNVERVTAVAASLGEQHALRAVLGDLHVGRDAVRAVEYIAVAFVGTLCVPG